MLPSLIVCCSIEIHTTRVRVFSKVFTNFCVTVFSRRACGKVSSNSIPSFWGRMESAES